MGTGSYDFFITPEESDHYLKEVIKKTGLWLILHSYQKGWGHYDLCGGPDYTDQVITKGYDQVFFSSSKTSSKGLDSSRPNFPELGWVQYILPKRENKCLYHASLGYKSDWYDDDYSIRYENEGMEKVYKKIRTIFKKGMKSPVWSKNIKFGGSECHNNIGFSDGAAEWEKNGGELCQLGVGNIRFSTVGY